MLLDMTTAESQELFSMRVSTGGDGECKVLLNMTTAESQELFSKKVTHGGLSMSAAIHGGFSMR